MNLFLLPVCEGVVNTHCNDPLFGFCYYLWRQGLRVRFNFTWISNGTFLYI